MDLISDDCWNIVFFPFHQILHSKASPSEANPPVRNEAIESANEKFRVENDAFWAGVLADNPMMQEMVESCDKHPNAKEACDNFYECLVDLFYELTKKMIVPNNDGLKEFDEKFSDMAKNLNMTQEQFGSSLKDFKEKILPKKCQEYIDSAKSIAQSK